MEDGGGDGKCGYGGGGEGDWLGNRESRKGLKERGVIGGIWRISLFYWI